MKNSAARIHDIVQRGRSMPPLNATCDNWITLFGLDEFDQLDRVFIASDFLSRISFELRCVFAQSSLRNKSRYEHLHHALQEGFSPLNLSRPWEVTRGFFTDEALLFLNICEDTLPEDCPTVEGFDVDAMIMESAIIKRQITDGQGLPFPRDKLGIFLDECLKFLLAHRLLGPKETMKKCGCVVFEWADSLRQSHQGNDFAATALWARIKRHADLVFSFVHQTNVLYAFHRNSTCLIDMVNATIVADSC